MARIDIVNANNIIEYSPQKAYFKLKNTGGPKGDKGDKGDAGAPGQSATIAVGTTTTLPAGSSATVTNTGTASSAVLNFGIPKGDKGDKGDTGAGLVLEGVVSTYADLPDDLTEEDAGKGYEVAADGKLYVWDGASFPSDGDGLLFRGAKGDTGAAGADGAPGTSATVAVGTTTTGSAGTNASVTNSGTSSAAVFNFTIPRGADGQNGTNGRDGVDGQDGQDGFSPIATVTQTSTGATITITDATGTTTADIADGATTPIATTTTAGKVKPDGTTITVTANGTITAKASTMFYLDPEAEGNTRYVYNNFTLASSDTATAGDIASAAKRGQVILSIANEYGDYVNNYLENVNYLADERLAFTFARGDGKYIVLQAVNPSDTLFNYSVTTLQKQLTAGANISISGTTISATDTTYSAFTGATSGVAGTAGLVPAPTTSDPDKYLKGDGTWAAVSAGPTVVQTTGQSTTDVMSQKAVTDIVGNVESILQTLISGNGAQ